MKLQTFIFLLIIPILFTACSVHEPVNKYYGHYDDVTFKKRVKVNPFTLLSKKEKEFLTILEKDKYASLCSSKSKFDSILSMEDKKNISKNLEELFYDYTDNLANSCIKQTEFKNTLKKKKYKENKQFYEVYNVKVNKQKLKKLYLDNKTSIKNILSRYTPNHPNFFELIKKLDKSKLSKSQYNKLRLNIERIKVLKEYKNSNFIQLNIPSYNFSLYENGRNTKDFGTVVGSKEDQTPILSSKLSYFIVNPAWNIPDSIAKNSIIPKALKNKKYLKKKNIVIRKTYDLDSKEIKFSEVNWKKYLKKDVKFIPYKFIQLPSKTNGMGRVKFMFSNPHAVYMHDTIGTWRF